MSEPHYNPPLRRSLAYRLASHPELLARMLSALGSQGPSEPGAPALARLTTRSRDDLSVAMLDAFATTLDVLHFYQERIANQGFLRTATEQRALQELSQALGCQLDPGVAASTILAFTVDDSPQWSGAALVPAGTRVQSTSVAGQRSQTFETTSELSARSAWNRLQPRQSVPPSLEVYRTADPKDTTQTILALRLWDPERGYQSVSRIFLQGTKTRLQRGDLLLLECTQRPLATPQAPRMLPVRVKDITPDPAADRTGVELEIVDPAEQQQPPPPPPGTVSVDPAKLDPAGAPLAVMGVRFSERDLAAQIAIAGWNVHELKTRVSALRSQPSVLLRVHALRQSVPCFGHNAPLWQGLLMKDATTTPWGSDWDDADNKAGTSVWLDSRGPLYSSQVGGFDLILERPVTEVVAGSFVVLEASDGSSCVMQVTQAAPISVVGFGSTGRGTGLSLVSADLRRDDKLDEASKKAAFNGFKVRSTSVLCQSELLPLADQPLMAPIEITDAVVLDGMVMELTLGQPVLLSGEPLSAPGVRRTEVARLSDISHFAGYTTLRFLGPLKNSYTRLNLTLCANAVPATHGETRANEVLGSGDHSKMHQRFTLKSAPLTYVSAATSRGIAAELQIRVGDVLWEEVPSLYGQPPGRNCYALERDPDGRTVVCFGDGVNGARLPSGQDNVAATYRVGLGLEGTLAAGTLTLLPNRPSGIKAVTNPLPTQGAAAPANREEVRDNAPRWVRTLDRVVSLRDYEDFARSFAGIAKAQALLLRVAGRPLVHITIAGADGADVPVDSALYQNLFAALQQLSDAETDLSIVSYARRLFTLQVQLRIDPRYNTESVLTGCRAALLDTYAFSRRSFGQPVAAAEILELMHSIEGVQAAVLLSLRSALAANASQPLFPPSLTSSPPPALISLDDVGDVEQPLRPLGLLLLHPAGIELEVLP